MKKFSKKLMVIMIAFLTFAFSLNVTATEGTEKDNHKHKYVTKITVQATKTSYGERTYTCECGYSYTESIDPLKLANPKTTDFEVGEGQISFTVQMSDEETNYVVIYRSTNGATPVEVGRATREELNFVDTSVVAGEKYSYSLKAFNDITASTQVATNQTTYLEYPVISYTHDEKGMHLSWTEVKGATKYYLQKKTNDKWSTISETSSCSYTDTTLAYGEERTYRVYPYAAYVSYVKASECTAKSILFGTPSGLTVVNDSFKRLYIKWNKAAGADGYILYRSTSADGEFEEYSRLSSSSYTTFSDTSIEFDTTYYYKVAAYAGDEIHMCDEIASGVAKMIKPVLAKVHYCTPSSITVRWESVSKADGYYVYRKTETGSWKKVATVKKKDTETYSYKNSKVKGTYYYAVSAYIEENGKKYASDKSEPLLMSTLTTPKIKSISQVDNTNKVKITWNKIKNAGEYRLYRRVGSKGSWEFYESTEGDETSFVATLVPGKTYYWKVQAVGIENNANKVNYIIGSKSDSKKYSFSAPKFSYDVITSTSRKTPKGLIKIKIKNRGSQSIRFYSADSYLFHDEFESYDRELRLVTSGGKKMSSTKFSKTKTLYYEVVGDKTMFVDDSTIRLVFKYDGIYYLFCCSGDGTASSVYYLE